MTDTLSSFSPGYGPGQPKTIEYQASDFGKAQIASGAAADLRAIINNPSSSADEKRGAAAGLQDFEFGYDASESQEQLNARRAAFVWPSPANGTPPKVESETRPRIWVGDVVVHKDSGDTPMTVTGVTPDQHALLDWFDAQGSPQHIEYPVADLEIAPAPAVPDATGGEPAASSFRVDAASGDGTEIRGAVFDGAAPTAEAHPAASPVVGVIMHTVESDFAHAEASDVAHQSLANIGEVHAVTIEHENDHISFFERAEEWSDETWHELLHVLLHTLHRA